MRADLSEMQDVVTDRLRQTNVSTPGEIRAYDAALKKADVLPAIIEVYGDGQALQLPVITGVPVIMPGTKTARITLPIAVGDNVLLIFSQRSLDLWLTEGGRTQAGDIRMHAMSDAMAIPGLFPFNGVPTTGVELELTDDLVNAGKGGTLRALLNELAAAVFNTHSHAPGTYIAGGNPVTGVSAAPTQQMSGSDQTTVLKAE